MQILVLIINSNSHVSQTSTGPHSLLKNSRIPSFYDKLQARTFKGRSCTFRGDNDINKNRKWGNLREIFRNVCAKIVIDYILNVTKSCEVL